MISKDDIKFIMPQATLVNIEKFYNPLVQAMEKYLINTPMRQCCFLAQIAHESGQFLLNLSRYIRKHIR